MPESALKQPASPRYRTRGGFATLLAGGLILLVVLCLSTGTKATASFTDAQPIAAGGAQTCTITGDHALACWGDDSAGQVSEMPEGQFFAISSGGAHSCAIRWGGELACWGDDSSGQVSDVPEGHFFAVSSGGAHSCAIRWGGELACWGDDSSGQVSDVPEGHFFAVSSGGAHSCAIRWGGELACWGDDSSGQVSEGPTAIHLHRHHNDRHHHHDKDDDLHFRAVAAGGSHTCAILDDWELACWGDDSAGQLEEVPDGHFFAVSAGNAHSCAIRFGGELACWGDDGAGQAGAVPEGHFLSISAGGSHSCAIRTGGGAICWGNNEQGQSQPRFVSPPPAGGTVGTPYIHSFETTPQNPAPKFGLVGGKLPPGLQLGDSGELAGTPTAAGTYSFDVAAVNGITPDTVQSVTMAVVAPPAPVVTQAINNDLPPPTAGKTVNVKPAGGIVRTKCPGKALRKLLSPEQIPIECLIDVRHGTVDLESSTGGAETRSGYFWGGIFGVLQSANHNWDTELRLAGQLKCERRGKSARRGSAQRERRHKSRRRGRGRKLWGSGKGNFKTSGNYGSASVRGTTWLVVDRCDGSTLFKVSEGTVWVQDFVKDRQVVIHAGERYIAKAAIPRLR